jgi:HlyD family secretion protein
MLVSRQRSVDAAQANVQEIQTQIDDSVLKAPTIGRVLFRLAEPGEVLSAGGKVLTIVNLADVYMEIFLPSGQAHRVKIGSEARIKLDILDFAVPGTVTFVSPESQFTPKQVETPSEREKLMFRVKIAVPTGLVRKHIEQVKTGVRGVGYVRLDGGPTPEWPAFLKKLPPDAAATASSER